VTKARALWHEKRNIIPAAGNPSQLTTLGQTRCVSFVIYESTSTSPCIPTTSIVAVQKSLIIRRSYRLHDAYQLYRLHNLFLILMCDRRFPLMPYPRLRLLCTLALACIQRSLLVGRFGPIRHGKEAEATTQIVRTNLRTAK